MSGRLALILLLLVASASNLHAAEKPAPRPLTDAQVRGLVLALDDPLVQLEALKWIAETRAGNAELFEPVRKLCRHDDPQIRNQAITTLATFGDRAVEVLTPLVNQADTRRQAAMALEQIGEKAASAVDSLSKLLSVPNVATRQAAANALGQIGEKAASAVEPLTRLLADGNPVIREAAANALGRMGEKVVEPLTRLLADPNPITRELAADALGRIGEKAASAVEPLIRLLSQPDLTSRLAAVEALGRIGEKATSAIEPLTRLLVHSDVAIQAAAADALGRIGEKAASAVEPLIRLLSQPDYTTRLAAVEALGRIGEKATSAIEPLTRLLVHSDVAIQTAAADALGRMGEKAVEPLTRLLADGNLSTRQFAAMALARIGDKAVEALTRLLTDPNSTTRQMAARTLAQIGQKTPGAVEPLTRLVLDPNPATREAAAIALEGSGDKAASVIEPLTKLLADSSPTTREAAANVLGGMGEKAASAIEPLTKLLADPKPTPREAAASALGRMGEKAVEPLIRLLTDPNPTTRRLAAKALEGIGEKAAPAVDPLIKLLAKPDFPTLEAASNALGRIGEKAVEPLTRLLADPNPATRQLAAKALVQIGDKAPRAVEPLIKLLAESNGVTRQAAASALGNIAEKAGLQLPTFLAIVRSTELDPAARKRFTALLRRNAGMSPGDLCELLEVAHDRYDQRSERILDAYLVAGDREQPLVRWLGGRSEADLPPFARLSHEQIAGLIHECTALLPDAGNAPNIRTEIAHQMNLLSENTRWSAGDLDTLQAARDELRKAGMTAEATTFGGRVESLEWWPKVLGYLRSTFTLWAGHVLFWVGLIAVYPYSRWVQAFFFWNPWVRRITGLVYVPWLITLVPFLCRRLLRPFQPNLIPDRFKHAFQKDSYFAQARITATRDGQTVTHLANEYLKPPLRGPRVIEAPSGYGKTTLLQWFIQQPGHPRVVLQATECDQGVMKAIQQCVQGLAQDAGFLQTLVYSGGLDVIIDGLNEASPETRGLIGTFVNDHFCGNYLLTTQPLLAYKMPRAAELWKLQPLAADQVQAFLLGQWPRVSTTAAAHGVSQEQYEAAVRKLLAGVDPQAGPDQCNLATPLDAALIAELLAQNVEPDLNNLTPQHVNLARDRFREIAPAQEPGFKQVGQRALAMIREQKAKLDLAGLEGECDALLKAKLVINHGTDYFFRHDCIRDYFIALSIPGVAEALELRQDPRFTGVFEFLPLTLDKTEADELGETLKQEAADLADNRVWSKYQRRWDQPGRFERIEEVLRTATTHFHARNPGETPNFEAIGERTVEAIERNGSPNWNSVEREVESLLAARVIRPGLLPTEPVRFRNEQFRWYFVAQYLAGPGKLDRAKVLSTDDRFAGSFEFLPRLLSKSARDELGRYLEKASRHVRKEGPSPQASWERYRKSWRRRRSA
jgi:HEAT repeat protein